MNDKIMKLFQKQFLVFLCACPLFYLAISSEKYFYIIPIAVLQLMAVNDRRLFG